MVSHRVSIDDYLYLPKARYFLEYPATPLNLDIHYLFSESEPLSVSYLGHVQPLRILVCGLGLRVRGGFFVGILCSRFGCDWLPDSTGPVLPHSGVRSKPCAGILWGHGRPASGHPVVRDHPDLRQLLFRACIPGQGLRTDGLPARLGCGELPFSDVPLPVSLGDGAVDLCGGPGGQRFQHHFIAASGPDNRGRFVAGGGAPISQRAFIRQVIPYGSAFSYLIVYAVIYRLYFASDLDLDSPTHAGWPRSFLGHLAFFWPPGTLELPPPGTLDSIFLSLTPIPYTPVAVTLSIVAAIGFSSGWTRRFLLTWLFIVISLFLNPWSGDILIRYFSGPNISWRIFYLLQFPLVAAIVGAYLHTRIEERFGRYLSWVGLGAFTTLSFLSLWARDLIELPPRYKLLHAEYETAAIIVEQAPPRPMLAPQDVAGIVTMLSADHPQISIRSFLQATLLTGQEVPEKRYNEGRQVLSCASGRRKTTRRSRPCWSATPSPRSCFTKGPLTPERGLSTAKRQRVLCGSSHGRLQAVRAGRYL